jgi:polar amino acid transport system substrate-binding protein
MFLAILATCAGSSAALASTKSSRSTASTAVVKSLNVKVPAELKKKGKFVVGVKCDFPPFGFTNASGANAGIEIDFVKRMATYAFGKPKVKLICTTSAARIPYLTSKRVDMVAGTMAITPDRAKVISFSLPYFATNSLFLAEKGNTFKSLSSLQGKTVAAGAGTPYSDWFKTCAPSTSVLEFATTSQDVSAVASGRAFAYVDDGSLMASLASKYKGLVLTGPIIPAFSYAWGFGMRKNDTALVRWVNAAIKRMQKQDFFWKTMKKWLPAKLLQNQYRSAVRRPGYTPNFRSFAASYSDAAATSCRVR